MRRPLALALAALALAAAPAVAAPAPVHRADGKLGEWQGTPTDLGGHAQLSRGELIDTDYIYDDHGPDLDGLPSPTQFRATLAPASGDYRYPNDPARYGYNAADLREVRLAADGTSLHALIALQTLKRADAPIAMLAIDADGKASTGAAAWPDGAGIDHTPGADDFVTVWGSGARVVDGGGYRHRVRHGINLKANALEVDVPWKRLGKLSPHARVWAIAGLAAPGGRFAVQHAGATAAFDVAFQGDEDYSLASHWSDARQSHALATGDLSRFAHRLDVGALRRHVTRRFHPGPGFYDRVFRSRFTYGEGISLKNPDPAGGLTSVAGTASPEFRGRYQTYGLYLPRGWRASRRAPLLLDGHSLDVNHNEYRAVGHELPALGDARHSIVITPLARGIDTWYLDAGMGDVFEAWRDVRAHYEVDRGRTDIAGYSMGGYMTYRLGLLDPDAFARAAVHVGPPAYFSWPYPLPLQSTDRWRVRGNTNLLVDNGLNLPYEINQGNADELVPVSGVVHQADTFKAAGNPYRFYHHVADDHLSFLLSGDFVHTRDWLGSHRRVTRPVRVRYVRYPAMDLPRYGLRWDHAYWVRDVVVRRASAVDDHGEVDATTSGLGRGVPVPIADPVRTIGPGAGASPATVTGQHLEDRVKPPRANAFAATLSNVSSLRLVTSRMGLRTGRPLTATLRGDGRTRLVLEGTWDGPARLDGAPVTLRHAHGRTTVTVTLAAGRGHTLRIG